MNRRDFLWAFFVGGGSSLLLNSCSKKEPISTADHTVDTEHPMFIDDTTYENSEVYLVFDQEENRYVALAVCSEHDLEYAAIIKNDGTMSGLTRYAQTSTRDEKKFGPLLSDIESIIRRDGGTQAFQQKALDYPNWTGAQYELPSSTKKS